MMKAPSVFLRPEITPADARALAKWLKDKEVNHFLNEKVGVTKVIEEVAERTDIPVLTPLFNRDGQFRMVCDEQDERPVGFVKLAKRNGETEIVVAIGDRERWGEGIGTAAIFQSLNLAFFEMRVGKVIAHIDPENIRSERAFKRAGFKKVAKLDNVHRFCLTFDEYLKRA